MSLVDWDLAAATAGRLAARGPELSREEAHAVVRELRDHAYAAVGPVREVTGMVVATDAATPVGAVVVDRRTWAASNVEAMRAVLERWDPDGELEGSAPAVVRGLGSRGTALQLGAVLAWMSSKVLGQFEVFAPGEGRLLLVAPNIVAVERSLDVPPDDFRLWVCLHEETHRVQFGAVPWLRDHLADRLVRLLDASDLDTRQALQRLVTAAYGVVRSVGGAPRPSIIDALQTPEQRAIFDELTALMSLLEGHADVVMDEVGPAVVPSVALIRERFTRRREQPGPIDALARRALGVDAKLRQYRDGAAFVRGVVAAVGMAGFNQVWDGPTTLPTRAEIDDPAAWLARVQPS